MKNWNGYTESTATANDIPVLICPAGSRHTKRPHPLYVWPVCYTDPSCRSGKNRPPHPNRGEVVGSAPGTCMYDCLLAIPASFIHDVLPHGFCLHRPKKNVTIITAKNNYTCWIAVRLSADSQAFCVPGSSSFHRTNHPVSSCSVFRLSPQHYCSGFCCTFQIFSLFVRGSLTVRLFWNPFSPPEKRKEVPEKIIVKTQKGCTFPDPHTGHPLGSTFAYLRHPYACCHGHPWQRQALPPMMQCPPRHFRFLLHPFTVL